MFWGWPWFGNIFWVAIIIVGIILITNRKRNNFEMPHDTPLDILKKRYAKGEISKEQFEQMKRDIQ